MKEAVRKFKETVEINTSIFNRVRTHRYFPVTFLLFIFLLVACFHIWQRVRVVSLVKEVAQLKQDRVELLDDKKKIYADIAELSMTSRIEGYARDTLGLKPVAADRMFTLVKKNEMAPTPDELELMYAAIKRVSDYLPMIESNSAAAQGVEGIKIDTSQIGGWDR